MKPEVMDRRELPILVGLLALSQAPWIGQTPAVTALSDPGLNRVDVERMERGYYEGLLDANRSAGASSRGRRLAQPATGAASRVALESGPMMTPVDDLREHTLTPGFSAVTRRGLWTNNAWGLRDREHAQAKTPGTLRLALLGDSIGAGWGVEDGAGFEPLLETELDSWSRSNHGPAVEILNFAVPAHAPGQRWEQFVRLGGWAAEPDLLVYEATPADLGWDDRRLRGLLPRGIGWDAPQYQGALKGAGIHPGLSTEAIERRLSASKDSILEGVYRTIAAECDARGIPSVWVLIPRVGRAIDERERRQLIEIATRAGFRHVLDLSRVFAGAEPESLAVSPRDYHPNQEGHARIAMALSEIIRNDPSRVGWPVSLEIMTESQ